MTARNTNAPNQLTPSNLRDAKFFKAKKKSPLKIFLTLLLAGCVAFLVLLAYTSHKYTEGSPQKTADIFMKAVTSGDPEAINSLKQSYSDTTPAHYLDKAVQASNGNYTFIEKYVDEDREHYLYRLSNPEYLYARLTIKRDPAERTHFEVTSYVFSARELRAKPEDLSSIEERIPSGCLRPSDVSYFGSHIEPYEDPTIFFHAADIAFVKNATDYNTSKVTNTSDENRVVDLAKFAQRYKKNVNFVIRLPRISGYPTDHDVADLTMANQQALKIKRTLTSNGIDEQFISIESPSTSDYANNYAMTVILTSTCSPT